MYSSIIKTLIITFSYFLIQQTMGADHVFTVVITDGHVLFEKENRREPKIKLLIGDSIHYGRIQIVEKNYLSLVHKNGNIIELNKPGIYEVKDLETQVKAKTPAPICSDLINYFFDRYYKPIHYTLRYKYMQPNGVVTKCYYPAFNFVCKSTSNENTLLENLLEDSTLQLKWTDVKRTKNTGTFKIFVSNIFGDSIYSLTTRDTVFDFTPSLYGKLKDRIFLVEIIYVGDDRYFDDKIKAIITILQENNSIKYYTDLKRLKKEFPCSGCATSELLYGLFNEKNLFNLKAKNNYDNLSVKLKVELSDNPDLSDKNEYKKLLLAVLKKL